METLVQLIFIIALAKFCLKAALSGRLWAIAGYAAVAAGVALALYPLVIEQPLTIIGQLLSDKQAVENVALLTTAEAIAGIFVSVYLLDNYFRPRSKRTTWAFALKITPGVLVFCAIGYFELLFFKFRAGGDFLTTAVFFSALLFAVIWVTALLARHLLRAESLKLEMTVILNMAILVAGLLISSSVADYNTSHAQAPIQWGALAALATLAVVFVALGLWLHKTNFKNFFKTLRQWN